MIELDQLRADNAWLRSELAKAEKLAEENHARSLAVEAELAKAQGDSWYKAFMLVVRERDDLLREIRGVR